MIFRPLPDASPSSDRPLSIRTIRRVPVPDPFLSSSGRTSTLVGSPEGPNRLSQTSSQDEHQHHAPTNFNKVRLSYSLIEVTSIYTFFQLP
jgi:hypothetical protein